MEEITSLASASQIYEEESQTRKGPWTMQEDMELIRYISLHGDGRWSFLAKAAGLKRTGKSCRLRWVNCLRPDLKRSKITPEEEHLIVKLHDLLGNKWSRIAQSLPGRTGNEIKNYWRTRMKKKKNVQADNDYGLHGDIPGSFKVNDDGQPSPAMEEDFEKSNYYWLPYNCSMGPLSTLLSSDFFTDGATQDGKLPPSSSYMVASPEAFYDNDTYMDYSDVLWNMDEQHDHFIDSPQSGGCGDDRQSY